MTVTVAGMVAPSYATSSHTDAIGRMVECHGIDFTDLTLEDRIPLDLDHGEQIGEVLYVERRQCDNAIMAVGVVDDCDELLDVSVDTALYFSPECEVRARGDDRVWTGRRPHLRGLAVTATPAQIGLWPIKVLPGAITSRYEREKWPWEVRRLGHVERAGHVDRLELRRRGLYLHEERPPLVTAPAVSLTVSPTIERRSAATGDVTGRTIELVAVPHEREATVIVDGRAVGEVVTRGAFDGSQHRRVPINRDHIPTRLIGRTSRVDPWAKEGVVVEALVARTPLGDESLALARDGCLDASIEFAIPTGGATWEHDRTRRRIHKAILAGIALVPDPAYVDARVLAVRSFQ